MQSVTDLKSEIARLHAIVAEAKRVFMTGPVDADGDSVGATLALTAILRQGRPDLEITLVTGAPIPDRYAFLDGVEEYRSPAVLHGTYDAAFLLDGVRHRIGDAGPAYDAARQRILIDHHESSNPGDYDLSLLDVHRASTCEIIYEVMRHPLFDVTLDRPMARQLYTGIAFDTGTFRYSNTAPGTLRLAAELLTTGIDSQQIVEKVFLDSRFEDTVFRGRVMSGIQLTAGGRIAYACVPASLIEETDAGGEGTEGLINHLVFIQGVEVAALMVEKPGGWVKISFRSRGQVNVAQVARDLSPQGGGHDRASGVTLEGSMDEVRNQVIGKISERLP